MTREILTFLALLFSHLLRQLRIPPTQNTKSRHNITRNNLRRHLSLQKLHQNIRRGLGGGVGEEDAVEDYGHFFGYFREDGGTPEEGAREGGGEREEEEEDSDDVRVS